MKRFIVIAIGLLLALATLTACGADEPPAIEPTPEPVVEATPTPTPAPAPEPVEPSITVTLNNYHTRYFDYNDIPFDISVIGDFDSYEVIFVPIETEEGAPELDLNGLPYGIGQYNVFVNFATGDSTDIFESDIVVSIVERPLLLEQLTTISDIPGHISWGEEIRIHVDEDKTIETDYYIAHIAAGSIYSSWLFPFFDYMIDVVHDFTGLYLPDSGERFNIIFSYEHGSIRTPSAGCVPHVATGELTMWLNDSLVGIDTLDGHTPWYDMDGVLHSDASMLSIDPFRAIYEFSHEFAHILDFAFFTNNPQRWSFVHGEGFATFVNAYLFKHLDPQAPTAAAFPLSRNFNLNLLYDLVHNRLEYMLSRDDGSFDHNPRTTGSIFYLYIYEEFGMDKVLEVFEIMVNRPSGSRIAIINDILGVDIQDTFPAWHDENVRSIPGYWS